MFSATRKVEVTCSHCKVVTLRIPRPLSLNSVAAEWSVIPCPRCGKNLADEARQALGAQVIGMTALLFTLGATVVGVIVWQALQHLRSP